MKYSSDKRAMHTINSYLIGVKAYSTKMGVSQSSLYRWRRKFRKKTSASVEYYSR